MPVLPPLPRIPRVPYCQPVAASQRRKCSFLLAARLTAGRFQGIVLCYPGTLPKHQEDVSVTLPSRFTLATLVGLGLSHFAGAQEPLRLGIDPAPLAHPPLVSANQQVADTIAEHLRQSGHLHQYNIDVVFQNGTAELSGTVCDQFQREEALRLAHGVPGVERVLDHLTLTGSGSVQQTQALAQGQQEPAPLPRKAGPEPGAPAGNGAVEPMPINGGGMAGGPHDLNPPRMPPYAWPTYAPYNNYSRVAYPQFYPYNAWPYIGPIYPFPKIPLGWRKVSLEWQDGHWWYGQHSNSHDWWRLRYW